MADSQQSDRAALIRDHPALVRVQRWTRDRLPLQSVELADALDAHFAAIHKLLEDAGHRPWGVLELRLPSQAHDCEVIYRWEMER